MANDPFNRPLLTTSGSYKKQTRCNVCAFFSERSCIHEKPTGSSNQGQTTPSSECSFYTALRSLPPTPLSINTAPFLQRHDSFSSTTSDIRAHVEESTPTRPAPALRRKISPTEVSLREIRARQARLQAMQSEEQLRQMYESNTLAYLESPIACLDSIEE